MFSREAKAKLQIRRATELFQYLRTRLNSPASVRLWDGSLVPLGENVEPGLEISISGPGVIGTLLRSPKPETLLRLYARGAVNYHCADMVTFIETARVKNSRIHGRSESMLTRCWKTTASELPELLSTPLSTG